MSYTATVFDANGNKKQVTISDSDSRTAIANDYREIEHLYNPKYVTIERIKAAPGEEMHIAITVHAPTHYLTSPTDQTPKPTDSMTAHISVLLGYPGRKLEAWYDPNYYLASDNVFRSGRACISKWIVGNCTIGTTARKLIHDMIHDPMVARPDSVANANMIEWQAERVKNGEFPTMDPTLLELREEPRPPRSTMPARAAAATPAQPAATPARRAMPPRNSAAAPARAAQPAPAGAAPAAPHRRAMPPRGVN